MSQLVCIYILIKEYFILKLMDIKKLILHIDIPTLKHTLKRNIEIYFKLIIITNK